MYNTEQRRIAIETLIRLNHSYADTIAELGYPTVRSLRSWWQGYERTGKVPISKFESNPRYSDEQKRTAVDHYLSYGRSLARTMRMLGFPKSRAVLVDWIDEIAPNERKCKISKSNNIDVSVEEKIQAIAELEARSGTAAEVANRHGVCRVSLYTWRRQILSHNMVIPEEKGLPVRKRYDDLPDDIETLKQMEKDLKIQVSKLQMEIDVRQATLEILKKDPGTDPKRLKNALKATIISSLQSKWKLKDLLALMDMAKSSYEYAVKALVKPKSEKHAEERRAIMEAFDESGGTYGYRRIVAQTGISEWTVRTIMDEENLAARSAKKKYRYSSYRGEISVAPENLLRDERGKHHFRADKPNELWITDVTEFRIPAGKTYLSPIIDCFDGMPISWTISTSPNAEMADSSLLSACSQLNEGEHPIGHSDRGSHYRWPGWINICNEYGLVRSMSRKGCSPDNARAEGFFGRLKIEFFYGRDWKGVTLDEFAEMLDAYLRWYRDVRLKSDLGYKSPLQYRIDLGLIA